jgi:hypothetical protein
MSERSSVRISNEHRLSWQGFRELPQSLHAHVGIVSWSGYDYFQFIIHLPPDAVQWGGVRLSPLSTSATDWLLYQPRMIDECGAVGGMRIGRGNRSTRRNPVPVPLCPPQIPHELTWGGTRAAGDSQSDPAVNLMKTGRRMGAPEHVTRCATRGLVTAVRASTSGTIPVCAERGKGTLFGNLWRYETTDTQINYFSTGESK